MRLGSPTRKLVDLQTAAWTSRPGEMRVLVHNATPHRRAVTGVGNGIMAQLFSTNRSPARFMGMLYSCIVGGRRSITAWRNIVAA